LKTHHLANLVRSYSDLLRVQLRVDMNTFVISGPNTVTLSNFGIIAGSVSTTSARRANLATNCLVRRHFLKPVSPGFGMFCHFYH
jgi:hypothetical protein